MKDTSENKLPIPNTHFWCPRWGMNNFSFKACRDKCGVDFTALNGDLIDWRTGKFLYCNLYCKEKICQ